MARDPPSLLASSELRDISPTPTSIRSAKITIIHPQLRDLILPLERGRVLYPRGQTVEEQRWLPSPDHEEGDADDGMTKRGITGSTRPLLNLSFVPNCLTASSSILACGGQHGELYIRDLPQPPSSNRLNARFVSSASAVKMRPFTISTTLPGRSINNSIIIPPAWLDQWNIVSQQRKLGFVGRGSRNWDEVETHGGADVLGRTVHGEWVTSNILATNSGEGIKDLFEYADVDAAMDLDDPDSRRREYSDDEDGETEIFSDDDEDMADHELSAHSPTSTSSVATYPNTVPFLHAPRIPHLPNPSTSSGSSSLHSITAEGNQVPRVSSQRRSASFTQHSSYPAPILRDRSGRASFQSLDRASGFYHDSEALRPLRVSSSRLGSDMPRARMPVRSVFSPARTSSSSVVPPNAHPRTSRGSRAIKSAGDVPRILISNNDCTVKVFALTPLTPTPASQYPSSSTGSRQSATPRDSGFVWTQHRPEVLDWNTLSSRPLDRLGLGAPRAPSSVPSMTATGAAFEWVSSAPSISAERSSRYSRTHGPSGAIDSHRATTSRLSPVAIADRETALLQRELERASGSLRMDHDSLLRDREDFERIVGMHVGPGAGLREEDEREERRLNKVGGTRFKVATNHSSLSPDLRMMVSVGDSTDVNLFEVIDGGREFRRIAVYDAATDAGFSTAWSKDGRKFAVASQDGQVTVWDHRSSRPLAVFHTSSDSAPAMNQGPSFMDDVTASHNLSSSPTSSSGSGWNLVGPDGEPTLRDPITGAASMGTSTSGREAARVVKFSPEGSNRDLMVFSEENSNIHVIDAQTFNTHLILPVSHIPQGTADPDVITRPRLGVEGGGWGIAGVAFDPSGDWLYSGTERTVVEWDLRTGGRGIGTWGMV